MKMREDENIGKYSDKIKESVNAIRASGGKIEDEIVIRKVLRNFLHIYGIRVLAIQEMRCDSKNDITLDALVQWLIMFELDNFDNYHHGSQNMESTFKAKLTLSKNGENSKGK